MLRPFLRGDIALRPYVIVQTQPQFRKLWVGDLFSRFGSSITRLALPLTATVMLGASPVEMGILAAAGTLPNLLLGLLSGVIVDRLPRRPILIATDIGRALLLTSIPAAALLDVLRLEQLYIVAFLVTCLDLFFDVASISFMPVILGHEKLADGNTALNINNQIAKIGGPSAAGVLVAILTAPMAIIFDAISFLISAAYAASVRISEPSPPSRATRGNWWADTMEGLNLVIKDDILRSIVGTSSLGTLAGAVQAPLLILFLVRGLELSPMLIGMILAMSGVASIPGSLLATSIAEWAGQGRAIAAGTFFVSLGMLLIPLAAGPLPVVLAVLIGAHLLIGIGIPIYAINQLTARQLLVPNHLQGRANASRRFLMFGAAPLGAAISGYLGQVAGLRLGLLLGALLMGLALLWTIRSPLWLLREIPSADTGTTLN